MVTSYVPLQWLDIHLGYCSPRTHQLVHMQDDSRRNVEKYSFNQSDTRAMPTVSNILVDAKSHEQIQITTFLLILTGCAPSLASLLEKIEKIVFPMEHAYGITKANGRAMVCEWKRENELPREAQVKLKATQEISVLTVVDADVKDLKTM
ncbi:unnamed protein product [Fraxinus pennsylvanica]|uniref:Uncharacterized protein n=1 Tax=Fraxinus pennsylvanica TaxID=56036 RepID=A0AAD2EAS5_9LAMI|nr:unnamed protein product [Fraxinus pennsylvanica]